MYNALRLENTSPKCIACIARKRLKDRRLRAHNEKKSGKEINPSRSLCYFPYFTWIQNQNQFDLGPLNLKRIG